MPTKDTSTAEAVKASAPDVVHARHYAGVALSVLGFSLLGIYLRPLDELSVLWITNAMLLALFLRMPRLATPLGWGSAAVGYVVADLLTGGGPLLVLARSSADLISVATAMTVLRQPSFIVEQGWREPGGLPTLFFAIIVGSLSAGTIGGTLLWLLLAKPLWLSITSWSVSELISYIIFLPCILSTPKPSTWRWQKRPAIQPRKLIPLVMLLTSLLANALLGGPGALAFPVIALLACALSYGLFLTSLLTMATSIWLLIATTSASIHDTTNAPDVFLSIRLGVASIALAPIVVACVTAARQSNLKTLRHMAEHDALTDLLNRRTFRHRAQKVVNVLGEQRKNVALLMIDIDHFKKINDTHGHVIGDEVLRTTARRLRNAIRSDDLCARLGGEEFLVLIPECTPDLLRDIAERIHQTLGNTISLPDTAQSLSITASIGGVLCDAASTNLEAMLLKADHALYDSKEQGRNRTSLVYDT